MHRCEDSWYLTGDGVFPLDPDLFHDRLTKLVPRTNNLADGYWHHLLVVNPREHLAMRLKQKVYLARYARQGIFDWEGRPVTDLQECFAALSELVGEENAMNRQGENR